MPDIFITWHAIKRYRELVAALPDAAIREALDCPAIRVAIDFGARFVRLSGGQRVVLSDNRIVTILPRGYHPNCLEPARDCLHNDGVGDA